MASLYLTAREIEIIELAAQGYSGPETAKILSIGQETIKSHRKKIIAKMLARNMTHAVAIYLGREIPRERSRETILQVRWISRLKMLISKHEKELNDELEKLLREVMRGSHTS